MTRLENAASLVHIGPRRAGSFERALFVTVVIIAAVSPFDRDLSAALAEAWANPSTFSYYVGAEAYYAVLGVGGLLGLWSTWTASDRSRLVRRELKSEAWALFIVSTCLLGYCVAAFTVTAGFTLAGMLGSAFIIGGVWRVGQIRTDLRRVDLVVEDGTS